MPASLPVFAYIDRRGVATLAKTKTDAADLLSFLKAKEREREQEATEMFLSELRKQGAP